MTNYFDFAAQRHGRKPSSNQMSSAGGAGQVDTKAVRTWAGANGIELSRRGRVPAEVINLVKARVNTGSGSPDVPVVDSTWFGLSCVNLIWPQGGGSIWRRRLG